MGHKLNFTLCIEMPEGTELTNSDIRLMRLAFGDCIFDKMVELFKKKMLPNYAQVVSCHIVNDETANN